MHWDRTLSSSPIMPVVCLTFLVFARVAVRRTRRLVPHYSRCTYHSINNRNYLATIQTTLIHGSETWSDRCDSTKAGLRDAMTEGNENLPRLALPAARL